LQGPFIFDDHSSVEDNLTIRHLWPIGDALSPPAKSFVGGRPMVNFSLALNYAWGGLAVWGYHAFNLAVHVLAGLTLYGIVRRTLLRPGLRERFGGASGGWVALAVAVLWTVHPLQTEAVTYISQRCESLMGLFYLLSLYGFLRGAQSRRALGWFSLSVAACYLGVASKEVIVTAPLMVLLYDRTFVSGSFREAWARHWRLYLGLASSWLWLGYLMTGLNRAVGYGLGITWWGYALTQCRAVVQYLRLALWPHPLILDYGRYVPTGPLAAVAPYALILAVLATGVLFELKRQPAIGFVGAWFFVILAPTSSVVPVVGSPMAEHRMYLPLAAVVTLAVIVAFDIGKRLFNKQQGIVLGCLAGGSLVVLLTFLTIQRNRDYNSEVTIWQDTVEKRPNNPRAHYNLGAALLQTGKLQNATGHLEQALRIKPDYAGAHNDLGLALVQLGRPQEAIGHYEQSLRIKPDFAKARDALARLQASQ
jgi:tetratricopeptide (TPR) repeat protein